MNVFLVGGGHNNRRGLICYDPIATIVLAYKRGRSFRREFL